MAFGRFCRDHSTRILARPDQWAVARRDPPTRRVRGEHHVELFHLFPGRARRQTWPADTGAVLPWLTGVIAVAQVDST